MAKAAKFNLIFDLNVLTRTPSGKWDPTNAIALLKFSQEKNLTLDWQLGNGMVKFNVCICTCLSLFLQ